MWYGVAGPYSGPYFSAGSGETSKDDVLINIFLKQVVVSIFWIVRDVMRA